MENTSKRLRKGRPYVIYWRDHAKHDSEGAWTTTDSVNLDLPVAVTAGWVIDQNRKAVAIAQTIDNSVGIKGEVGNIWYIMRNSIEKVVPVDIGIGKKTVKKEDSKGLA